MNDSPNNKTFWTVVTALFFLGSSAISWSMAKSADHQDKGYHFGVPMYVSDQVKEADREWKAELKAIRVEISQLREALISSGLQLK